MHGSLRQKRTWYRVMIQYYRSPFTIAATTLVMGGGGGNRIEVLTHAHFREMVRALHNAWFLGFSGVLWQEGGEPPTL